MKKESEQRFHVVALAVMAIMAQCQSAIADNRMEIRRESDRSISIALTNSDAIAGFQFSLRARGGIAWGAYRAGDRSTAAGLAVYQYLKDDSTLNVVLLAPVRSALPCGKGMIGTVDFSYRTGAGADTVSAFLSGVALCDANAQLLPVTVDHLKWNLGTSRRPDAATFTLEQNYPNPFNPSTTIVYNLNTAASVRLEVFDVAGRLVNSLVNARQPEGRYSVQWNAAGGRGEKLASGMYFVRLQVDGQIATGKMILTK